MIVCWLAGIIDEVGARHICGWQDPYGTRADCRVDLGGHQPDLRHGQVRLRSRASPQPHLGRGKSALSAPLDARQRDRNSSRSGRTDLPRVRAPDRGGVTRWHGYRACHRAEREDSSVPTRHGVFERGHQSSHRHSADGLPPFRAPHPDAPAASQHGAKQDRAPGALPASPMVRGVGVTTPEALPLASHRYPP